MDEFQPLIPRLQSYLKSNGDFIDPEFDDLYPPMNEKKLIIERNKAKRIS